MALLGICVSFALLVIGVALLRSGISAMLMSPTERAEIERDMRKRRETTRIFREFSRRSREAERRRSVGREG